ncbi:hypothetical protein BD626DRAFT_625389 [Schizophyllum amplum]|uniref:Uncharacterized protein n=1 Tax=Schizophyllum amplum TaxID=97359 RepID=A0A550CZE4_9AGAR|nr:hypothetical protein BD626DRAFT_625389 [Auriculariopsis ampla]
MALSKAGPEARAQYSHQLAVYTLRQFVEARKSLDLDRDAKSKLPPSHARDPRAMQALQNERVAMKGPRTVSATS